MPFSGRPPGTPKTGGRGKGTRNRATASIMKKLEAMGCDPLVGLAKIAMDEATPIELRVRCFGELAPYIYPKRKAVETTDATPTKINVITRQDDSVTSANVDANPEPQP
jgi:hypothetical protein